MRTACLAAVVGLVEGSAAAEPVERITGTVVAAGSMFATRAKATAAAEPRGTDFWSLTVIAGTLVRPGLVYDDADVKLIKDRYCVAIATLDEPLCFRKADVEESP